MSQPIVSKKQMAKALANVEKAISIEWLKAEDEKRERRKKANAGAYRAYLRQEALRRDSGAK